MDIAKYIEHTLLKPEATEADIKKLVDEAFEYKFFGVCINPNFVKFTRKYIDETNDLDIVNKFFSLIFIIAYCFSIFLGK